MADVVGLIAASGQFIEQGNKIIKLYKDLHDRVRDVPTEMPKRIEVVEDLIRLCEGIKTRPSLETSHTLHALEACTNTAEELCKLFRGITFTADDPLSHKTWMAIVGKAKDSEINNKFHELEGHKASLGLGLGLATQ